MVCINNYVTTKIITIKDHKMPKVITNNLQKEDAIRVLERIKSDAIYLSQLIEKNRGRTVVLWRRAETICNKTEELIDLFDSEVV
jgi:hypothetical protein